MSDDQLDFSTSKETWLRFLYSTIGFMFLISFVFALFNVVKYMCRMRGRSMLIILFYVSVFVLCLSHSALYAILTIDPEKEPFIYDSSGF